MHYEMHLLVISLVDWHEEVFFIIQKNVEEYDRLIVHPNINYRTYLYCTADIGRDTFTHTIRIFLYGFL